MTTEVITVKPEQLLLDPNNYRFHDLAEYRVTKNHQKFGETNVQEHTLDLLQSTPEFQLQTLKDSITNNGFIPIEQPVVEKYDEIDGRHRYLVVEGNRRIAAIKILLDEHRLGNITLSKEVLDSIQEFQVVELTGSVSERTSFKQVLMAIRHVAGVRAWGAYQQAKLISELYQKGNRQFGAVAQAIGIRANEVARRYRAIKALEQMEKDDEYGDYASPQMYAAFHEAIASPVVKEWLGWSDDTFRAENSQNRTALYELLIPRTVDGESYPPKLKEVRQVRLLKDIVDKPVATAILLDPEKSLEDAQRAAAIEKAEDIPGIVELSIGQAIRALNQLGVDAWFNLTDSEKVLWAKLTRVVDSIKSIVR